ncbi:MAG: hypothetical protein KF861_13055 [Planctomycetaceae bacterium]|nr:hypothetical protein [Planctomycetaceae bacterium]
MSREDGISSAPRARHRAQRWTHLAELRAIRGESNRARALFLRAVAVDPTPASLIAFAIFLDDRDHSEEAISQLEQALDQARRLGNPSMRAVCCANLCSLYRRLGNRPLATQFHQLALAAEMEDGSRQPIGDRLSVRLCATAAEFSDAGDHGTAHRLLNAAHAVCRMAHGEDRQLIEHHRTVVYSRLGSVEAAAGLLIACSCRSTGSKPSVLKAHDLLNLGHLLQAMDRLANAARCFRDASRRFHEMGATERSRDAARFEREVRRRAAHHSTDAMMN